MRILHLSDTHLTGRRGPDEDGVDAYAILRDLLHDLRHLDPLDLVVVSGDVADDGSEAAYRGALELVGGYAMERGAALACCVGNHDARRAFTAVLGTGHLDGSGAPAGRTLTEGRCAAVSEVGGLRIITLDSLVPGEVHGELEEGQLADAARLLREPSPRGSVVVLHHPPIAIDTDFWRSVNLRRPQRLIDVLTGSDVRAVLCGHNHLQQTTVVAGIPVWGTPGVITRIDLTAEAGTERAVLGAGATLIDLDAGPGPFFTVLHSRHPDAGREVYSVDLS